jgi:hypothetical protein
MMQIQVEYKELIPKEQSKQLFQRYPLGDILCCEPNPLLFVASSPPLCWLNQPERAFNDLALFIVRLLFDLYPTLWSFYSANILFTLINNTLRKVGNIISKQQGNKNQNNLNSIYLMEPSIGVEPTTG